MITSVDKKKCLALVECSTLRGARNKYPTLGIGACTILCTAHNFIGCDDGSRYLVRIIIVEDLHSEIFNIHAAMELQVQYLYLMFR